MYDYQQECYADLRASISNRQTRPVLKLVTGGGKTIIAANMIGQALMRNRLVLFIVPILSLLNKTVRGFEEQGITDIGVIQRNHPRTNHQARVQVASMQTLTRRPQLMQGFDLVIVDECHEQHAEMYQWMARDTRTIFIGLSATPYAKGMGRHWTNLIIGPSYATLEHKGRLSPLEVYEPEHIPNRKKLKIVAGEFSDSQAEAEMSDKTLVADVYKMWQERGSKARWFVFGQNCNHAKMLMKSFEDKGVRCGYIDADTPSEERDSEDPNSEALFCRYRRMDIHVMFSVGCLGTGIDEDVRGISLAYLTRSRMKLEQDLGRLRRVANGKQVGWVNDHGGNIEALGMPEDYSYDHLDSSDPKEKGDAYAGEKEPPKPKKCGKCRMLLPPRTSVCPKCGERPVVCNVETVDGTLVKREAKKEPKEKYSMDQKQAFYSQLIGLLMDRKKTDDVREVRGRASNLYREKFQCWPDKLLDMPAMPERAVIGFEKHSRIRYAKSKEAESKRAVTA